MHTLRLRYKLIRSLSELKWYRPTINAFRYYHTLNRIKYMRPCLSSWRFFNTTQSDSMSTNSQDSKPYEEPEVPKEVMESLKNQITRISQCMSLGNYELAQKLLKTYHKGLIQYYKSDHPAYCTYENNQGILWRLNGQFEDSYEILYSVYKKYAFAFSNLIFFNIGIQKCLAWTIPQL